MVQIGADTYEDLTAESFEQIIDDIAAGKTAEARSRRSTASFPRRSAADTTLTDAAIYQRQPKPAATPSRRSGRFGRQEARPGVKGMTMAAEFIPTRMFVARLMPSTIAILVRIVYVLRAAREAWCWALDGGK